MFVASQLNTPPTKGQIERILRMRHLATLAIVTAACALFAGQANAATIHRVLVSDVLNSRVLEFETDGTFVGVFADGFKPSGILQGPNGNVFIGEGNPDAPIREYQFDGTLVGNAFNGTTGTTARPDDLAFNASSGKLFFNSPGFSSNNQEIRRVDSTSSSTVVVPNTFNDPNNLTTNDTLDTPRGLAIDADGDLIVADRNNERLLEFDATTFNLKDVLVTGKDVIQTPLVAADGNIFYTYVDTASEKYFVEEIDSSGALQNTFTFDFSGGSSPSLFDPIILPDGDLLVSAFNDDEVLRLDPGTSTFTTFASGSFDGEAIDGPQFLAVITIPSPAALPAGLALMGVATLRRRRR